MPNLTLRGCCIGTGRPKVIIPIVERTESAILEKAAAFSTLKADCVEWRADWFDAVSDVNALAHCLHGLRAALGEKLLLVTFRTHSGLSRYHCSVLRIPTSKVVSGDHPSSS